VLNTSLEYHEWNKAHNERMTETGNDNRWTNITGDPFVLKLFGKHHVAILNEIVRQTDARIVVSSSWRMHFAGKIGQLAEILARAGVSGQILGSTPTDVYRRYDAVWAWLRGYRLGMPTRFVCLDDEDPGARDPREVTPHVCLTNPMTGLVEEDIARAVRRLKKTKVIA
jgi:hypothetical protein